MLILKNRILKKNGTSIYPIEELARIIFTEGTCPDHVKTVECDDSLKYREKYDIDLIDDLEESDVSCVIDVCNESFSDLMSELYKYKRDDTPDKDHNARLDFELDFFKRSNTEFFLLSLKLLVEDFIKHDVVWGVGRGSSCASYVLFLMGVHDINPIKYDIDFKEFSKENKHLGE